MGRYIQTPGHNHNKAEIIAKTHNGEIISCPKDFSEVPEGKALICVVDNGPFEAAAYCYNEREYKDFSWVKDTRFKMWLLIDKDIAERIAQ